MSVAEVVVYKPLWHTRCKDGSIVRTVQITEDRFETAVFSKHDPFPHIIHEYGGSIEAVLGHNQNVAAGGGRAFFQ